MDCLFCKIGRGEIPSTRVFESETVLAFRDINPQAPTHILVIPKRHIASVDAIGEADREILGDIFCAIPQIAAKEGLTDGYRVISNVGDHGCQSVRHLHFHILGGKQLSEKMD